MNAYILVTVSGSEGDRIYVLEQVLKLVDHIDREPSGRDWDFTTQLAGRSKSEIQTINRMIRRIEGVIGTALAFDKPLAGRKYKFCKK